MSPDADNCFLARLPNLSAKVFAADAEATYIEANVCMLLGGLPDSLG
jgi:hypothetical protein